MIMSIVVERKTSHVSANLNGVSHGLLSTQSFGCVPIARDKMEVGLLFSFTHQDNIAEYFEGNLGNII